MAILPGRPGMNISVVCNGVALQEYTDDDEEAPENAVSKYIEATSGAEFGIQCELTPPFPLYTILLNYFLDQKWVSGAYIRQARYVPPSTIHLQKGPTSVRNGQAFLHRFAFAELTIDGEGAAPVQEQIMKEIKGMGQITVEAHYVMNLQKEAVVDRTLGSRFTELGKIPEKALKGSSLSHQASLRAGQPAGHGPAQIWTCDYIDPAKQPFAKYTFKYRSRDSLKSLLIIPRSPSPVPLEERDVETLSAEEMRELLRRRHERDEAARAIKQERGIKRERQSERSETLASEDDEDDELSIVSTRRCRVTYRTTVNEDGMEVLDLT